MNRTTLIAGIATVGAAALATVPAVLGLVGNPSFSHQVPVRVPSQASHHGSAAFEAGHGSDDPTPRSTTSPTDTPTSHPTDDARRGRHSADPGRGSEPGDDRGGSRTARSSEPGDDRGSGRRGEPEHGSSSHSSGRGGDGRGGDDGRDRSGSGGHDTGGDDSGGGDSGRHGGRHADD